MNFLLNILFAVLAFFLTSYLGGMVAPDGPNKDKLITVVAVIVGIVVFLANFAVRVAV